MSTVYINAIGVGSGGGLRLLEALFEQTPSDGKFHFFLDHRVPLEPEVRSNVTWEKVNSSRSKRFVFEKQLSQRLNKEDTLFCFNNIPPLFKNKARNIVFVQNRHVLMPFIQKNIPLKERLRLTLQWLILKKNFSSVDKFIVQTESMKKIFPQESNVEVIPFLPKMPDLNHSKERPLEADDFTFFYPADPWLHKNHKTLISAWSLLARENLKPKLILTLENLEMFEDLNKSITENSLNIDFVGTLSYKEVFEQYTSSDALIFPSLRESFGMPLMEAAHVGLPILSSEKDFVYDVVDPSLTFNPEDAVSISERIKKFMNADVKKPVLKAQCQNIMQKL